MRLEGDRQDADMDVGMVLHLASPGMEHAGEAEVSLEFGPGQVLESGSALAQEQIVEHGGMLFADWLEFAGNGEGDEEVVETGEEAHFLAGAPGLLVEGSALGTIAVVAGVVGEVVLVAVIAAVDASPPPRLALAPGLPSVRPGGQGRSAVESRLPRLSNPRRANVAHHASIPPTPPRDPG